MEENVIVSNERKDGSVKAERPEGERRLAICKACPIYMRDAQMCDPSKWLSVDSDEVSNSPRSGFVRGCGCLVTRKVWGEKNHCGAGRW